LVEEGDRKEENEIKKRQEQNALIAAQQQEQLERYKGAYISQLRREKEEGLAIKKKVEMDMIKEKEEGLRRRREAKQAALDTKIANGQLKQIKQQMMAAEEKEEDHRQQEAKKKEELLQRRKQQEKIRFEQKLAIKQRMIDAATKQLSEMSNETDQREFNQAAELKSAEDAEMEKRSARRERQAEAIKRSRQLQLDMKRLAIDRKKEEDRNLADYYQTRNLQVEEEEQAEELERIQRNVAVRKAQERQMGEKRRIKMEERAQKLLAEEQTKKMMEEEDERFLKIARGEFEQAKKEGKNVICIGKAMNRKDKTIMAAGGTRV